MKAKAGSFSFRFSRHQPFFLSVLLGLTVLALAACGGGGGGLLLEEIPEEVPEENSPQAGETEFTVGGTVSGLSGALGLKLNGGDDLLISADGPFTFAASLSDGANYAVTSKFNPPISFARSATARAPLTAPT